MEEIKNLFIKYFGFYPDIISTTEHVYISPPSRIISSLVELSKFSDKKILRIAMTDTCAIPPEKCLKQICLPHLLNRNIFLINIDQSKQEILKKIEEDNDIIKDFFKKKSIFSLKEKYNYYDLINLYSNVLENIKTPNSVDIYNNIIKAYTYSFHLDVLNKWLNNNDIFGIDSKKIRFFLKEAFDILFKTDPVGVNLFGKYLETKQRLKMKDKNDFIQIITWAEYINELNNNSNLYNITSEIILYIYSYYGGSHFGNDHGIIQDINTIRNSNNLIQITEHNKDYSFEIKEKRVKFHHINMIKNNLNLSQETYKTVETIPELYVILGRDELKNRLNNLISR